MTVPSSPIVDVEFVIRGASSEAVRFPVDHGYALYAAVSRVLPWVHGDRRVGIHPIRGRLAGERRLVVSPSSRLTFRVPADLIPALLPLAGRSLDVDGSRLQVGTPTIRALQPAERLYSRLVTIKGMQESTAFLQSASAQLEALGIRGQPELVRRRSPRAVDSDRSGERGEWIRRTLRVKDKEIVGYAVVVAGLSALDSVRLQSAGLGGRRRFGCGIFVPLQGTRP